MQKFVTLKSGEGKSCSLIHKIPLVMRLICLFLIVNLGVSFASVSNAQNTLVSLNINNNSVASILEAIEKQTEYSFIYDSQVVDANWKTTIDVVNKNLFDVLSQLFSNSDITFTVVDKKIVLSSKKGSAANNQQQEKRISGKVTDENGEPIIGANIIEKGTTNGTITDFDGNFALSISSNSNILISYIGYLEREITPKEQSNIVIALKEDLQRLEEVVVIGYGTVKKTDLTGSVFSISAKDFNSGISRSPDQLLAGKVPGLVINRSGGDPTAGVTMQLRGPSSLTASTSPFYVIDGVPGASIDIISPDEIESMNVLKDASATAIYGSRAANGVIMVTTRRGKSGKSQVHYSGYTAFESVSGRIDVLDAEEHSAFLKSNNISISTSEDGYNTNWQKELLRNVGFSHNHNLSLIGGSEDMRYNASVNYMNNQGIVKRNGYERINARIGLDQDAFNKRLRLGLTVSGSLVKSDHIPYSVFNYAARMLPESPVKSDAPEYALYDGYFQVPGRMNYYNPIALLNQRDDNRSKNTIQGTGKIGVDIIDGLVFDMMGSIQSENEDRYYYQKTTDILVLGKGNAMREFIKNTDQIIETTLNYSKTFNNDHSLKLMAGYSYQKTIRNEGIKGTNDFFTSDATGAHNLSTGNGDKSLHFQDYPQKQESKLISFFGRINYDYAGRYLLTATLRRDGSSKFGINNKWAMFPAVSLAWRITGEEFMKNQRIFHDLKLRLGYGKSGNQNIDPYTSKRLYGPQDNQFIYNDEWINSYGVSQNPNPDLKWETTAMTNIGIDFSVLGGRVSGSLDLYEKETNDMLYTYDVPSPPYQYNRLLANGASMTNRGVELMINAIPVETHDFNWVTTFNIAANKNKIGSLDSNIDNLTIAERYEGTQYLEGWTAQTVSLVKPGEAIGTFYTFKYVGYDAEQKKTLYENANGETVTINDLKTLDDYKIVGNALPKITYGWNNSFKYKRLDFNFFFRGVSGNKIFNASRADLSRLSQATSWNISKEAVKDGIMEAPISSSRWLESGSFLKLDNVTIGYQFNVEKIKGISKLRIYATGQNLFTITGYTGVDPEVSLSGLAPGIDDRNYYPKTRSFLFGVNLSF